MKKVPLSEVSKWINQAQESARKNPSLRFGQSLWNELNGSDYRPLLDEMVGGRYDFFYIRNNSNEVIDIFMEHYVDFES